MRDLIQDLFDLPRTFLAWIVFHLASWLDMKVIPSDDPDCMMDDLWEELKDVDIEDLDDE